MSWARILCSVRARHRLAGLSAWCCVAGVVMRLFEWLACQSMRARGLVITEAERGGARPSRWRSGPSADALSNPGVRARARAPWASRSLSRHPALHLTRVSDGVLYVAARHFSAGFRSVRPDRDARKPGHGKAEVTALSFSARPRRAVRSPGEPRPAALRRHVPKRCGRSSRRFRPEEATEQSRFLIDRLVERSLT